VISAILMFASAHALAQHGHEVLSVGCFISGVLEVVVLAAQLLGKDV
jgi:hypothetical protein